jgi:hypothetical protein
MKTCRFFTGTEYMAICSPIRFSKKAMLLVVKSVHNLFPDDIQFSENVEESDIFAETECAL